MPGTAGADGTAPGGFAGVRKCCEAERTWRVTGKTPEKFQAAARACQQSDQLYPDASCRFLAMQAGLLAAELQEGKPCPVCGSIEHPAPAVWR
ncbi:MAG: hypothetical protein ACLRRF_03770 [Clostridium fessum]